ncbi:MAG: hypothetical protein D6677_07415 [Calditrichaeota bacterium]|nr:MAG: hypothetical protein D6677_07415 [Calditrichota bacterium]
MRRFFLFFWIVTGGLTAQNLNSLSLAYAGNYTTLSRGLDAIDHNPANLAMYRPYLNEISLIHAGINIGNARLTLTDYNRYFTHEGHNGNWSLTDRQNLSNLLGDRFKFDFTVHTRLLAFAAGRWGGGISLVGSGQGSIKPGKPLDYLLYGANISTDFGFEENDILQAETYSAVRTSVSYAYLFRLDRRQSGFSYVSIGGTMNFYAGLLYAKTVSSSMSLQRDPDQPDTFIARTHAVIQTADLSGGSLAGTGLGFDVGITGRYRRAWHFSLAVSNIGANIGWSGHSRLLSYVQVDTVTMSGTTSGSASTDSTQLGAFSTPLPSVLSLGASLRLLRPLTLIVEYRQGLDTHFGNSTTPALGLAARYKPFSWLPLRSGITVGGRYGFLWGAGLGLHLGFVALDVSYALQGAMLPMQATGIYSGVRLKIRY